VTKSGYSALVKEAMAMRDGHLLKRAGREFAKNLIWMAVVFGLLVAVLAAATDLSLVGMMAFVGVFVAVVAAIVTVVVIWSGAHDETTRLGGHDYPGSPPDRGDRPGGGWDDVGKWPG
jgi:vacuolar-type H+-ATPase subunit I/STV1